MSTTSIISNFIPVHELEDVLQDSRNNFDKNSTAVKDQDLFLISQVSALATKETPEVIISKKLQYGTLKYQISDDVGIQEMKDNIRDLCAYADTISAELSAFEDEMHKAVDDISNDYINRDTVLSTTLCSELSTAVENEYIKKYGRTLCALDAGLFFKTLELSDGQLIGFEQDTISTYTTIDGAKVAGGCISGSKTSRVLTVPNGSTSVLTCVVSSDCYAVVNTQLLENDETTSPLEVFLESRLSVDSEPFTVKIGQFNNPGGFSGKDYYNYYYFGIPIKCVLSSTSGTETVSLTKLRFQYADGSNFKYSTVSASTISVDQFDFFATIAKADLEQYILKDAKELSVLELYKIKTNKNGMVTQASEYTVNDIYRDISSSVKTQISTQLTGTVATNDKYGTIKTHTTLSDKTNGKFGLQLSTNGNAYITVPVATTAQNGIDKKYTGSTGITVSTANAISLKTATSNELGGIKTGFTTDAAIHQYKVQVETDGNAYVDVPTAENGGQFGVVKLGGRQAGFVYKDADGFLKADPPAAAANGGGLGTVKVKNAQGYAYVGNDVFLQLNQKPSQIASGTLPTPTTLQDNSQILVGYTPTGLQNTIKFSDLKKQFETIFRPFPDYSNVIYKDSRQFVENKEYTCSEDCYVVINTMLNCENYSPNDVIRININDITVADQIVGMAGKGSPSVSFSGYCRKGDRIFIRIQNSSYPKRQYGHLSLRMFGI